MYVFAKSASPGRICCWRISASLECFELLTLGFTWKGGWNATFDKWQADTKHERVFSPSFSTQQLLLYGILSRLTHIPTTYVLRRLRLDITE